MRARDVTVPGEYLARVSGRIVRVRVYAHGPAGAIYHGGRVRPTYHAINRATERELLLTPGRLRPLAAAPVPRKKLGPMSCGYVREGQTRDQRRAHYHDCADDTCHDMAMRLAERDATRDALDPAVAS